MLAAEHGNSTSTREPVMQRLLLVLDACASQRRALTVREIVEMTGLAKTTVHRMCWRMVRLGMLEHSADGFSVGTRLFALANGSPVVNRVRVAAMPHLLELHGATGALPQLAISSGDRALILEVIFTRDSARVPRLVGYALPLHCTAVGKAIAARLDEDAREHLLGTGALPAATRRTIVRPSLLREHLERVADSGVAFSEEEHMLGVSGVAAAFKVPGGATAAIGCIDAWNTARLRQGTVQVTRAAAELERALA